MLAVAIFIGDGLKARRRTFGEPFIDDAGDFVRTSGDGLSENTRLAERNKRKEAQEGRGRREHAPLSQRRGSSQKECTALHRRFSLQAKQAGSAA